MVKAASTSKPKIFLIDSENVSLGLFVLNRNIKEGDKVAYFATKASASIKMSDVAKLYAKGVSGFEVIFFPGSGRNYLDKEIKKYASQLSGYDIEVVTLDKELRKTPVMPKVANEERISRETELKLKRRKMKDVLHLDFPMLAADELSTVVDVALKHGEADKVSSEIRRILTENHHGVTGELGKKLIITSKKLVSYIPAL